MTTRKPTRKSRAPWRSPPAERAPRGAPKREGTRRSRAAPANDLEPKGAAKGQATPKPDAEGTGRAAAKVLETRGAPKRQAPTKVLAGTVDALERLRGLCLAIPGAVEKLSHGEPTWFTGPKGKVFAMFDDHHHGHPHRSVYLPAPPGVAAAMARAEPARYWVPPYVGHLGWVAVVLDGSPDWALLESLLREAFAMKAGSLKARRR